MMDWRRENATPLFQDNKNKKENKKISFFDSSDACESHNEACKSSLWKDLNHQSCLQTTVNVPINTQLRVYVLCIHTLQLII